MTDKKSLPDPPPDTPTLRHLVETARLQVATTVNAGQPLLYWHIGRRVRSELLANQRAQYDAEIVSTLSSQLVADYGRAFAERNLRRMLQFAEVFPDQTVVDTLAHHLTWSHFAELFPLKQPLQRDFYAELCRVERWSVRTLRQKIDSMLYERTALSKNPELLMDHELKALREHAAIARSRLRLSGQPDNPKD